MKCVFIAHVQGRQLYELDSLAVNQALN